MKDSQLLSKISDLSDDIEKLIGEDNLELLESASSILKGVKTVVNSFQKYKYATFLKGLSDSNGSTDVSEELSKLIEKKSFRYYMISELQSIYNSNSVLCCYLKGLILAEYKSKDTISSSDRYTLSNIQLTLDSFIDEDIVALVDFLDTITFEIDESKEVGGLITRFTEEYTEKDIFSGMISKLISSGYFTDVQWNEPDFHIETYQEDYETVSEVKGNLNEFSALLFNDKSKLLCDVIIENKNEFRNLIDRID